MADYHVSAQNLTWFILQWTLLIIPYVHVDVMKQVTIFLSNVHNTIYPESF